MKAIPRGRLRRLSAKAMIPCGAGSSAIRPKVLLDWRDQHRGGAPAKVTEDYRERLLATVRRDQRSLNPAYSM